MQVSAGLRAGAAGERAAPRHVAAKVGPRWMPTRAPGFPGGDRMAFPQARWRAARPHRPPDRCPPYGIFARGMQRFPRSPGLEIGRPDCLFVFKDRWHARAMAACAARARCGRCLGGLFLAAHAAWARRAVGPSRGALDGLPTRLAARPARGRGAGSRRDAVATGPPCVSRRRGP